MKLNGTHTFKANSDRVYNAILDPATLQQCIPGCESVEQLDAKSLQVGSGVGTRSRKHSPSGLVTS